MAKFEGIVVVYCQRDKDGKCIAHNMVPPYGCHHIIEVYSDDSYRTIGTVSADIDEKTTLKVAKLLAGDSLPIKIDPDFYSKRR